MDLNELNGNGILLPIEYKPQMPKNKSRGIAIVGAGEIVMHAHLPAYRMAGFHVVGIYDVNSAKAAAAAAAYPPMQVFASLHELLEHPDVEIVDIAVPAAFQPQVAKQAAAAGKHLLCQKPLAQSYEQAKDVVDFCKAFEVKAAVNQQMRWSPGIQASKYLVKNGWIGTPLQGTIQVNVHTAWENWPWLVTIPTLEVMYHSIHYVDSIRYVLGLTPDFVYADGARYPGQPYAGETRTLIHLKFPGEARGLIHDNHNNRQSQEDWFATFRFEGTEGSISGTNGALYNYPEGREDTIRFYSNRWSPGQPHAPALEGRWFPHAFMGTMGELMRSIEEQREPENSIADHLITLQTVFAAYRSMADNRPVQLQEIASE